MGQQLYRLPVAVKDAVAAGEALRLRYGRSDASLLVGKAAVPLAALARVIAEQEHTRDLSKRSSDGGPSPLYVHTMLWGGVDGRAWAEDQLAKALSNLYISRPVVNGPDIVAWAKSVGFTTTVPAEELHVTIAFSRTPLDWATLPAATDQVVIPAGSPGRVLKQLGPKGAIVLVVPSAELAQRWQQVMDAGASWDWTEYQPHITISFNGAGAPADLQEVPPWDGQVVLGAEVLAPINEDWADTITEKNMKEFEIGNTVLKVDAKLGLVLGYAIVCKENGKPYFDVQGDHIPEDAMVKAAVDFMLNSRISGNLHGRDAAGEPIQDGHVPFLFPLTTDVAQAFGFPTNKTGLLAGIMPSKDVLAKYESGEYTGFSIGGYRITDEEVPANG